MIRVPLRSLNLAHVKSVLIPTDFLRRVGVKSADEWAGPLSASCASQGIVTRLRIAAFLANVLHETLMLTKLSESLNYKPSVLLAQWPNHFSPEEAEQYGRTATHPANEWQIAENAYGGRYGNDVPGSGDGWTFRGAGGLGTTFRANYADLGKSIGWKDNLENLPAFLRTVPGACTSAVLYWTSRNCNRYADHGDLKAVRRLINGGLIGFPVVNLLYQNLLYTAGRLGLPTTDSLNNLSLQKAQAGHDNP